MVTEAHIQAIARFLVGFGTEQDNVWRTYNLDFAGHADYDASGAPVAFRPVGESGYSLGSLQWDFGQGPELAVPFVEAFVDWIDRTPTGIPLASDPEFAGRALALTGSALTGKPALGLRRQDVRALSEFVRTDAGSNWVNAQIDAVLIGSDAQDRIVVRGKQYGLSLVGVARQLEGTACFKAFMSQGRQDVADLIYAMGMKTYNQSPRAFSKKLQPFLSGRRTDLEVAGWYKGLTGGLKSGVEAATNLSQFWSSWKVSADVARVARLTTAMDSECLANPVTASRGGGDYVLAKQVFEDTDRFNDFTTASDAHKDFVDQRLFNKSSGAIAIHPATGRIRPGMLCFTGLQYVWDSDENAYVSDPVGWKSLPASKINLKTL